MGIHDSGNSVEATVPQKGRSLKPLLVAGGLVLGAYIIWRLGPAEVWRELRGGWWPGFIAVVGAYLLQQGLGTFSLWLLGTRPRGPGWRETGPLALARTRYIGEVLNYSMPTGGIGGEPYKLVVLGRREGMNPSFMALAAAKFLHVAAVGPFAAFVFAGAAMEGTGGPAWRATFLTMTALMAAMTVFLWLVVLWSRIGRGLLGGYYRIRTRVPRRFRGLRRFLHIDVAASKEIRRAPLRAMVAYACYMGMWFAASLEWVAISHVVGRGSYGLGLMGAGLFECATIIVAAALPVPAGMGTQETGKAAVAVLLGMPPQAGLAMSLIRRGRELLMVLTGAGLAITAGKKGGD